MSKLSQDEIDALFAQYGSGQAPESAPAEPAAFPQLEIPQAPAEQGDLTLSPAAAASLPMDISLLGSIEVEITVRLGATRRSIREILGFGSGAVLELDTLAGEAVDILVNGRLVAKGEVVVVGEAYGVRLVELVTASPGEVA